MREFEPVFQRLVDQEEGPFTTEHLENYDRGFRNVSGRRWEQRLRRVWAQPQGNMNIKEGVGLEKPVRSNMEHQPPKRPIAFLFSGS